MDIPKIMEELIKFRDDNDWKQYHTTKNLTISMCIRAAHLLDIFQWKDDKEISLFVESQKDIIEEKLADILISIFYLSNNLGIDSRTLETTMYCRLIKEGSNRNLTGQTEFAQDTSNTKIVPIKQE